MSKKVEALLDGDAETDVVLIAVAVDEAADDGHGRLGALAEGLAVHEVTYED